MPRRLKRLNAAYGERVWSNEASRQGWADVVAGRGYPAEYDGWDQRQQRDYERGRLRAAGAYLVYPRRPREEPPDIVQRTNGLKLVPRSANRRPRRSR